VPWRDPPGRTYARDWASPWGGPDLPVAAHRPWAPFGTGSTARGGGWAFASPAKRGPSRPAGTTTPSHRHLLARPTGTASPPGPGRPWLWRFGGHLPSL